VILPIYPNQVLQPIRLRQYPPITNAKDNDEFCEFLRGLLQEQLRFHYYKSPCDLMSIFSAPVIPNLSLGLSLSSPHLPPDKLDAFMHRMLLSRISRRVLVEHHIALSETYIGHGVRTNAEPNVGIISTGLNVKRSVERCALLLRECLVWTKETGGTNSNHWPDIQVDGHINTSFAYIREHLE